MAQKEYSASLTGNPFLLLETREIARLIVQGLKKEEIHSDIVTANCFQYKNTKSITKRFNAIYKRLDGLSDLLLKKLVDGSVQEAKTINLLLIAKTDRLFREFLMEIVYTRIKEPTPILSERELALFFMHKKETIPEISVWTDRTIKKLSQVYLQILYQAGIVSERKKRTLRSFILHPAFEKELVSSFSENLLRSITR